MDEKKKIAILGVLFVVIIGVGAFQFAKGGSPAAEAPVAEKKVDASTSDEKSTTAVASKNEPEMGVEADPEDAEGKVIEEVDPALIAAASLSPRDPFDGSAWDSDRKAILQAAAQAAAQTTPKPVNRAPRPRGMAGAGFNPLPIGGEALPVPEGGSAPVSGGKLPSIDDFPYTVAGTMVGDRPCVLFTDASGKQKLVREGGAIDGDSHVVSISKGLVTVNHRGKTRTFRVGEMDPSKYKNEDKR